MTLKPAIVPSTFLRHLGPIILAMVAADVLLILASHLPMMGHH